MTINENRSVTKHPSRTRNYVTQLMAMGYRVTLEPAA